MAYLKSIFGPLIFNQWDPILFHSCLAFMTISRSSNEYLLSSSTLEFKTVQKIAERQLLVQKNILRWVVISFPQMITKFVSFPPILYWVLKLRWALSNYIRSWIRRKNCAVRIRKICFFPWTKEYYLESYGSSIPLVNFLNCEKKTETIVKNQ